MSEEGLAVPCVLSEAVYATNALTSVNGHSPVFGHVPPMLPDVMAVADDTGAPSSMHSHRLREVALQAVIEGTAKDRGTRALKTVTRATGEEPEYTVGDQVEYFRMLDKTKTPQAGEDLPP